MILVVHNLPSFMVNINLLSSWKEFATLQICQTILHYGVFGLSNDFLFTNLAVNAMYTVAFSVNEKIRKELFVVNFTNSKTKRQMMSIFNSVTPSVVINKDGMIQLYNEGFENIFVNLL